MSEHKCDGNKDIACAGKVERYRVHMRFHDWGYFWYCAAHTDVDRSRGFTVDKVAHQEEDEK